MLLPLLQNNLLGDPPMPVDSQIWCVKAQGYAGSVAAQGFGGIVVMQGYLDQQPAQGEECG
jgi:hypothetical protein